MAIVFLLPFLISAIKKGQSTTDVATGQPNPQQSYQSGAGSLVDTTATTLTGVMPSSAGGMTNQDLGVLGGVSSEVDVPQYSNVMPTSNEASSVGYSRQQQPTQNQQQNVSFSSSLFSVLCFFRPSVFCSLLSMYQLFHCTDYGLCIPYEYYSLA